MAAGANHVIPERRIGAFVLEMMAERAVRTESGARIHSRMRIHMPRVREIEDDRLLALITRERQQIFGASRRKHRVALHADLLLNVLIKIVLMARRTLIVAGTLQYH